MDERASFIHFFFVEGEDYLVQMSNCYPVQIAIIPRLLLFAYSLSFRLSITQFIFIFLVCIRLQRPVLRRVSSAVIWGVSPIWFYLLLGLM